MNIRNHSANYLKAKPIKITGNLISNAIKFTPCGGSVTVELGSKVYNGRKTYQIVVKDTGIGVDEDSISEILSGQRTSTNGTGGERGYGFGLVLVKHLVDNLKGRMKSYSATGNGTTFDIILPFFDNCHKM